MSELIVNNLKENLLNLLVFNQCCHSGHLKTILMSPCNVLV